MKRITVVVIALSLFAAAALGTVVGRMAGGGNPDQSGSTAPTVRTATASPETSPVMASPSVTIAAL